MFLEIKLLFKNNKFNFLNQFEINQRKYKSSLLKLGNHTVLAIIALIGIGSATRVMEAGLACPDWPLCYGTFLPLTHMLSLIHI